MRADHSWPQRRQVYHATTHVLSGAGSTGRPQTGHDIVAVVGNSSNMQTSGATTVPFATVAKWASARSQRRLRGEYIRRREKLRTAPRVKCFQMHNLWWESAWSCRADWHA